MNKRAIPPPLYRSHRACEKVPSLGAWPCHPRQGQHIDRPRPGSQQYSGTSFDRRPGGQNIIDQQHPGTPYPGLKLRVDAERPPHVARPPGSTQAALRRRAAMADQQIRDHRQMPSAGTRGARQSLRQKGRLVITPPPQPRPMQRHGGDDVRLGDQFPARPGQPAPKGGGGFGPIGMFEAQNQITAGIVVIQHRAGTLINRRAADAGRA